MSGWWMRLGGGLVVLVAGGVSVLAEDGPESRAVDWAKPAASQPVAADPWNRFDAAPYAEVSILEDGRVIELRWDEPRKIRAVGLNIDTSLDSEHIAKSVKVLYWQSTWDGAADPIITERGAGRMGWDRIDDWTNGQWKEATLARIHGPMSFYGRFGGRHTFGWAITFSPSAADGFEGLKSEGVRYRKTLKVRLVRDEPWPKLGEHPFPVVGPEARTSPFWISAWTESATSPLAARVLFGVPSADGVEVPLGEERGAIQVHNGSLRAVRPLGDMQMLDGEKGQWMLPAGKSGGLEVELRRAVDALDPRYDRTIVTVRSDRRPFSFAADEVAAGDRVLIDDLGVLVTRGDENVTLEGYREKLAEYPGRTVYDRVFDEPEQTLGKAWDAMPLKQPLYFVHGLPGNRNAIRHYPDGAVRLAGNSRWFKKPFVSAKDSERKLWQSQEYGYYFHFPTDEDGESADGRSLKDGYLPLLRCWWQDGPIHYEQASILDKLDGDLSKIALDDPTVLLMRVHITNTSLDRDGAASLYLQTQPMQGETLYHKDGVIYADYEGKPRVRYLIRTGGSGELVNDAHGVRWTCPLASGASATLYLSIPTVTIDPETSPYDYAQLQARDFDKDAPRILAFWREQAARGAEIITPEPWLNNFYKAHALHLLVNCCKELDSDLLHAHVGTFYYGVYPNESCMMTTDLDRRGYHDEARRNYDAYLHYQGTVKFLGNFKSTDGLFYGAGGHETGDYNKSHGYVMHAMADHWYQTRDRDWMAAAAPKLIAACDWVTRERQATMAKNDDGTRRIEYGFLPAGSLEDVTDFWYWLGTNAATVWGFDALAAAMADSGHPEADRLLADAKAYHDDVMRGFEEARVRSPVVRLRDGTYVPKYPSRLYVRGRSHGWLRETLEGALFLPAYGLIGPDDIASKWIMQDYEDNLYISDEYGYAIPSFDLFWFSRGGFSMQANLLDGPLPYLYRDEIEHYVRAFFNGFASAYYPQIAMCNEHSLPELGYPAGDHFKTSDEAQVTYWLRLMYIYEDGDDLYLGRAIPRYWLSQGNTIAIRNAPTYFGPMSWQMTSNVAEGTITATIDPPTRNVPKHIYVRFRHPGRARIDRVTVNGKAQDAFDAAKEWVVLPGDVRGPLTVTAHFACND